MGFAQKKLEQIPVSTAKAKLLELVREVQQGHGFEITKGGETVARLLPPEHHQALPVTGFAPIIITGDILSPLPSDWTFDQPNLTKKE